MEDVNVEINETGALAFAAGKKDTPIGEMAFGIEDGALVVYHTEVLPEAEGKGVARALLNKMVSYAREQHLMIVPLCPYVLLQFKRNPDLYGDLWRKE